MDSLPPAVGEFQSVKALYLQELGFACGSDLNRRHFQSDPSRQPHTEEFILHQSREMGALRLQDMAAGRAIERKKKISLTNRQGELSLSTCQRQANPLLSGEKRMKFQRLKFRREFLERDLPVSGITGHRKLARRQQTDSPRTFRADLFQKSKVIPVAHPKCLGNQLTAVLLRQQSSEKGAAFIPPKTLSAKRQRSGERDRRFHCQPSLSVTKSHRPRVILLQPPDQIVLQKNIQRTCHFSLLT